LPVFLERPPRCFAVFTGNYQRGSLLLRRTPGLSAAKCRRGSGSAVRVACAPGGNQQRETCEFRGAQAGVQGHWCKDLTLDASFRGHAEKRRNYICEIRQPGTSVGGFGPSKGSGAGCAENLGKKIYDRAMPTSTTGASPPIWHTGAPSLLVIRPRNSGHSRRQALDDENRHLKHRSGLRLHLLQETTHTWPSIADWPCG
jgi:hypothetical protein